MPELVCGFWVSKAYDDPDARVCAKPAVVVAEPNAPHLYESGEERTYCAVHATEKRLAYLAEHGWVIAWLD